MPEQSYEDLVDRNENTTNYCVLDIESGAADATLRYYNIEGCQNNESPKTNDNCNYEYYNSMVAHEN
ncbi:hypothetical protein DPMN_185537 [Dreissena polymorpha]|uniref:Uncharacterized protein n=2 Tax=Dreissena polymorpha TaxID=45954 RepID=A0A9D4DKP9_DREPO|nr:hypothetical protein DPMN_185537 [Dreissena polymorpha]